MEKSDSDIPTALILMVSSRPCAFSSPRNMTPKNAKPLAHFDVNAPFKQKKQQHKSKCQVELLEILQSKCLKIWKKGIRNL